MKVNVIGVGRNKGVSKKTGNPYDNVNVYYTCPDPRVNGLKAVEKTFFDSDRQAFPVIDQIKPGDILNLEYGPNGWLLSVELLPAAAAPIPKSGVFGK